MNSFLVVFNTENRSDTAIESMNSLVKDGHFEFFHVLIADYLSVFLIRTHCNQGQLSARLAEMNDGSIDYWVAEHENNSAAIQLEQAWRQWAKLPFGDHP